MALRTDDRQWLSECWIWPHGKTGAGYGQIGVNGKTEYAHRVMYEQFIGPIPENLEIDHLCGIPSCVNPWHLEPVTHRENLLRSPVTITAINANKTHCTNGHQFTEDNTYRRKDRNGRECRKCRNESAARSHRKAGRR